MKINHIILISLAFIATTSACRYPKWPEEFRWHSAGAIDGMTCTHIHESADRTGTWHDNYFCAVSAPGIQGVGMRWSSAGKDCLNFLSFQSYISTVRRHTLRSVEIPHGKFD
eukprot:TCONS_00043265-protein